MCRLLIILSLVFFLFSCDEENDTVFENDEDIDKPATVLDEDIFDDVDLTDDAYENEVENEAEFVDEDNIVVYPGIYVSKRNLKISETGNQDFFEINLTSKPTAEVRFEIENIDDSEAIFDPAFLVFTPDNWSALQTVSVTGKDDDEKDGNISWNIYLEALSDDTDYNGFNSGNINITAIDDDSASVIVGDNYLLTSEDEEELFISVNLGVEPKNDVTLVFSSSLTSEGDFEKDTLVFTKESWNGVQKIALKGVDDNENDGDKEYQIDIAITSEDPAYASLEVAPLAAVNIDNDKAGIVSKISKNEVDEKGKTLYFYIKLMSQPKADVKVNVKSDDESEGTVDKTEVVFTTSNWKKNVKITLTGQDDEIKDGDQLFHMVFETESEDTSYNGLETTSLDIINRDNDKAGFFFENENLITTEDGGDDTIMVKLATMPDSDVEMLFLVTDSTEGGVAYEIFTISKSEWDKFYSITLEGVDDNEKDGDIEYQVQMLVASSDPDYDNFIVKAIDAINMDDD